ncbi:hypothetical protein CLM82_21505, partial [Streptomyces albidoflavus]
MVGECAVEVDAENVDRVEGVGDGLQPGPLGARGLGLGGVGELAEAAADTEDAVLVSDGVHLPGRPPQ